MELRLDNESVEINKGTPVIVFGPGNANNRRLFRCDELGVARRRFPFTHNVRSIALAVEEAPQCGHGVLVSAVPILAEVEPGEEFFEPSDQFRFHTSAIFYGRGAFSGYSHFRN